MTLEMTRAGARNDVHATNTDEGNHDYELQQLLRHGDSIVDEILDRWQKDHDEKVTPIEHRHILDGIEKVLAVEGYDLGKTRLNDLRRIIYDHISLVVCREEATILPVTPLEGFECKGDTKTVRHLIKMLLHSIEREVA